MMAAPQIEVAKAVLPEIPRAAPKPIEIKPSGFTEPEPVTHAAPPKAVVKASGFQNSESPAAAPARTLSTTMGGFDTAAAEGGAARARPVSRAGGFSDVSALPAGGSRAGSIASAAFGDATVDKGVAVIKRVAASPVTPVEIVFKPKPLYTDEARAKKVEGEVLLAMQFSASGEARVERVMRGLGYGLDESAIAAARGIRFRPAMRDGGAVDSAAVVHIVFQLAQ